MTGKPVPTSNAGSDGTVMDTRKRMAEMQKPALLKQRAVRYAGWRSLFIYAILIGNCFGIASLVADLKPEHLSDHAYTLCVTMIDIEIFLIFLLAFFLEYSDGRLTRPLYEEATNIWENLATRDALTGLANRLAFMHDLDEELKIIRGRRTKQCAVLFIDLNNFKYINDTYGHQAGDEVIITAAQRIHRNINPRDMAARLGGDEFAVLLRNVTIGHAQSVARDIDKAIRAPMYIEDRSTSKTLIVTASIGVRISDDKSHRAEEILHDADIRMYKAKAAARWQHNNRSRIAPPPPPRANT